MIKGIIFDLDGTLINTLYDMADSVNEVLVSHGKKTFPDEAYKAFVGNGMRVLIERALATDDREAVDNYLMEFHEVYRRRFMNRSVPYDGIDDVLINLNNKKIPIAVCTNKNEQYVKEMLDHYFPGVQFVSIIGERGDAYIKPSNHYPLEIAAAMGLAPADIAFVGDSNVDILTAKNANMIPVGVTWGFRTRQELLQTGAAYILNTPQEIFAVIKANSSDQAGIVNAA